MTTIYDFDFANLAKILLDSLDLVGNKSNNILFSFVSEKYCPLVKTQHPRKLEVLRMILGQ